MTHRKSEVVTPEAVLAHLRAQDPERSYDFDDGNNCAVATYAKEGFGCDDVKVDTTNNLVSFTGDDDDLRSYDPIITEAARQEPHTCGACADRLEELIAKAEAGTLTPEEEAEGNEIAEKVLEEIVNEMENDTQMHSA